MVEGGKGGEGMGDVGREREGWKEGGVEGEREIYTCREGESVFYQWSTVCILLRITAELKETLQ